MRALETDKNVDLVLVVGYDGTAPAQRALMRAADTAQLGSGRIEVVFVAHTPSVVALSPQAIPAIREGLADEERELAQRIEESLGGTQVKWHFQFRSGDIVPELLAAAAEQLDTGGPNTHVVLVVGGSAHKIDRYLNSTPVRVIRQDRFEVHVVP